MSSYRLKLKDPDVKARLEIYRKDKIKREREAYYEQVFSDITQDDEAVVLEDKEWAFITNHDLKLNSNINSCSNSESFVQTANNRLYDISTSTEPDFNAPTQQLLL